MTVEELLTEARTLTYEERKQLLQGLFAQMPKTGGLAGTITDGNDFETGRRTVHAMARESFERTARQFQTDVEESD